MIDYCKCIKTGCDIECDGMSWHGDLYASKAGVYFFKSCCRNEHGYRWSHVVADSLTQLGDDDEHCTFILGRVISVSGDFAATLRKYESHSTCTYFGVDKEGEA